MSQLNLTDLAFLKNSLMVGLKAVYYKNISLFLRFAAEHPTFGKSGGYILQGISTAAIAGTLISATEVGLAAFLTKGVSMAITDQAMAYHMDILSSSMNLVCTNPLMKLSVKSLTNLLITTKKIASDIIDEYLPEEKWKLEKDQNI